MTLLWTVACTWSAASWLAAFLYNVTVSPLIGWGVQPQVDLLVLIEERRPMSKGRKVSDEDYQAGYDLAARAVENRSLREIHGALRSLLPRARRGV